MYKSLRFILAMSLLSCLALAQDAPPPGVPKTPSPERERREGGPDRERGEKRMMDDRMVIEKKMMDDRMMIKYRAAGEFERAPFPQGKWWKNSELVQRIGISDAQVQQMEKIFQDARLKLIDLHANLQKQEVLLEPQIDSDNPDEAKVLQQIERVAAARGELEKVNAQMLLGIRRVMTADQWKKLKSMPAPGTFQFRVPGPPPEGAGLPKREGDF